MSDATLYNISPSSDFSLVGLSQTYRTRRLPVRQASETQSYTFNQKAIINFPGVLSDFRHSYITFYAQVTGNGGTYCRFPYPIQCIFQRATIYLGPSYVEDITNFSVLQGMFEIQKPYSAVNNLANEGRLDQTVRASDSSTGRSYQVRLRMQTLERVWPLHKANVSLRLELYTDNPTNMLEYDGSMPANNALVLNQIYYHYHQVDAPEAYDTLLGNKIANGGYEVLIHTWNNINNTNVSGNSGTVELPFKYKSLTRIIAGYRLANEVDDPTVDDRYINQWLQRSISSAYVKVNNIIYPTDKYEFSLAQSYREAQEVMNSIMESRFHALDRAEDTFAGQDLTNRFLLAYDLRRDNSLSDNYVANGQDTSMAGSTIQLYNAWSSPLPSNISIDAFGEYETIVCFYPGNKVGINY